MKLIKQNEPMVINTVSLLIYGEAGVGKTSLAFTADKPILLDFDGGSYRSAYRKEVLQIETYKDLKDHLTEFLSILDSYNTIIIDTIGSLQDKIKVYLIEKDPSLLNKRKSFDLWAAMLSETMIMIDLLKGKNRDLIILGHVQEKNRGDDLIKRPVIAGQSKDQIYRFMEYIGYMSLKASQRIIAFIPQDDSFEAKSTGGIREIIVPEAMPDDFLASKINELKQTINSQNQASKLAFEEVNQSRAVIMKFEKLQEFNAFIPKLSELTEKKIIWEVLKDCAKLKGFEYDGISKTFKDKRNNAG